MSEGFVEGNTVEPMLIDAARAAGWDYVPIHKVPRVESDVIVWAWAREAILRLNPKLTAAQADEVIGKLNSIVLQSTRENLVESNRLFRERLFDQNSYPFGKDGEHVTVKLFDEERFENNYCVVTNQWEFPRYSAHGGRRFDLVFLVNGIPMAIGEAKTPVNSTITWLDGAVDMDTYQKTDPEMFVPNALVFATEGNELHYGGIGLPPLKWGRWFRNEKREHGSLLATKANFEHLIKPARLLDIYRYYSVFSTDSSRGREIKVVCRYQQYHGGEAVVQRVLKGTPKKGLIWHFQGSGKSLLMVFAAQKIRKMAKLENPTVVLVDDRVDLQSQISGDLARAKIPNHQVAASRQALEEYFKKDQRGILITTIFKFGEVTERLSGRSNIILLVDEAHRTQEGSLGEKMRQALPNAFFFGLTGTPINKRDRNTFATFGADEDGDGYMSRYSFQDSVDDGATLELEFQTVPNELKIDHEKLESEFEELTKDINQAQRNALVRRTSVEALFTSPDRIKAICAHIARHFTTYVKPTGLKAQIVVYNRACCLAYKKELDMILGPEASTIVMDTNSDPDGKYRAFARTTDEENRVLDKFRDPLSPLKVVIVTSKLLTGFDAPILQCMYLDKPMKEHALLQAICRTNRTYEAMKTCGLIVDYVGVFDDVAKSLAFDEESVRTVIKNIDQVRAMLPDLLKKCLDYFPGISRTSATWRELAATQECLRDANVKASFGASYRVLHRCWETVSPNTPPELKADYIWVTKVFNNAFPNPGAGSGLIWTILGPKTIELIHDNVKTIEIGDTLEELVLNSEVVDNTIEKLNEKERDRKIIEIEKMLKLRFSQSKSPKIKKLAEKLEELREKMKQSLIESIDFLRELLKMAKEVVRIEKEEHQPEDRRAQAKAALTELFESIRNDKTPIIVENVVNDIDTTVVGIVRKFSDAFKTVTGQNEVKKMLRTILWINYGIKDNDVFDKAYGYVEQYY